MTGDLDLQQDEDAHWRSSKEFVRLLVSELNQTLKANKVSTKKRRQICTSFVFGFCNFVDHQWFKPDGKTQYPLICFANRFFDTDVPLDLSKINFPHKSVELHGMVHDEIAWFFDEMKEDSTAVPTGDVGTETDDFEIEDTDGDFAITQPCWTCKGTGQCFCVRKSSGNPSGCPRCEGTARCRHCRGSGQSKRA